MVEITGLEPVASSPQTSVLPTELYLDKYEGLVDYAPLAAATLGTVVGQVGVEPTMYPTSRVYSPLQSPLCLLTQIRAVRWKQPQTPLRLSLITLFCLSILEEPDIAPIL